MDGGFYDSTTATEPLILVFWATWCGPCEVELHRIQRLISEGNLPADRVLAISSFEIPSLVQKAVAERQYSFRVGLDPDGRAATAFKVKGTPTIYLLDAQQKIEWVTSGLSPLLEIRLRRFMTNAKKPTR
jgi:thiol-disulfide isomerase/thioredoxin